MASVIKTNNISITRYGAPTVVKGRTSKGSSTILTGKGSIQPLDMTTAGAETVEAQSQGNDIRNYKKMYTKDIILIDDYITEIKTGKVYKVYKVYHYELPTQSAWHYKVIMVLMES